MKNSMCYKYQIIGCIVIFLYCVLYSLYAGVYGFYCDSQSYWNNAGSFVVDGHFSFCNYINSYQYQGCLFPFILFVVKRIGMGTTWGWKIFAALMVTVIFGIIFPYLFRISIDSVSKLLRMLLLMLIFIYIWGDFLQYPLSDLSAAFFLAFGIFICCQCIDKERLINKNEVQQLTKPICEMLKYLCCGACLYISYNTRAAYLYAVIIVVGCVLWLHKDKKKELVKIAIALLIGAYIASVPQCVVNKCNLGIFSPKLYTEEFSKNLYNVEKSLQEVQLFWGVGWQRYETYVGDEELYPSAGVYFDDPIGNEILNREGLDLESFKFSSICELFVKYPLDTIGLYTRHLVSLITPAWNQIYIKEINTNKSFLVFLSITIWIIAGTSFLLCVKKGRKINYVDVLLFSMAVPGFLQLFGAPELRFFISIYLILYAYVFIKVDYKVLWNHIRPRWISFIVLLCFIVALWVSVFGTTLSNNREKVILINDRLYAEDTMAQ